MGRKPNSSKNPQDKASSSSTTVNGTDEIDKFNALRISISLEKGKSANHESIEQKESPVSQPVEVIDDSDDEISENVAETQFLVPHNSDEIEITMEPDSSTISEDIDIKNQRRSVYWSQPTHVLLDSHKKEKNTKELNTDGFTTNYNKSGCSCLTRCLRSIIHSRDLYVRLTCIPTKESKTTNVIYGVEQNAMWMKKDKNTLRYFIPSRYVNENIPMKILVELWDQDFHSSNDFMGSRVVDVNPATNVADTERKLKVKLRDGDKLIGILTLNVSYTETLTYKVKKKLDKELKKRQKKRLRYWRKRDTEFDDFGGETELRNQSTKERNEKYGMLKCEILTFVASEAKEPNYVQFLRYFGQIIFIVAFILMSSLMFWYLEKDWSFLDAFYFTNVSLSTVGYGDMSPTNTKSKTFACIFVVMSHLTIFVMVTSFTAKIVRDRHEKAARRRQSLERKEAMIKKLGDEVRLGEREARRRGAMDISGQAAAHQQNQNSFFASEHRRSSIFALYKELEPAKQIHYGAFSGYLLLFITWLGVWTVYFVYFSQKKLDWFEAIYFGLITATTVGYGDIHGENNHDAKIFISCVILIGVAALANIASAIAIFVGETQQATLEDNVLKSALTTIEDLKEFDECNDGEYITKAEFLQGMLLRMGLVDRGVIDQINDKFLEYGGMDGVITFDELQDIIKEKSMNKAI